MFRPLGPGCRQPVLGCCCAEQGAQETPDHYVSSSLCRAVGCFGSAGEADAAPGGCESGELFFCCFESCFGLSVMAEVGLFGVTDTGTMCQHIVACIGFWHLAGIVHRARQIAGECITLHVLRDDKFVSN